MLHVLKQMKNHFPSNMVHAEYNMFTVIVFVLYTNLAIYSVHLSQFAFCLEKWTGKLCLFVSLKKNDFVFSSVSAV